MTAAHNAIDDRLADAELFFKFAFGVSTAVLARTDVVGMLLNSFSWGAHQLGDGELTLSKPQERVASAILEHTATYLLAAQMDAALEQTFPNRLQHPDADIQSAAWIARLIRNSFTHDPLSPHWLLGRRGGNRSFAIGGLIRLDTSGLEGQPLRREDFGGPLALLRLVQYVRRRILGATSGVPSAAS